MKMHLLTAVSRPENLSKVGESISIAIKRAPEVDVTWHCRFDADRRHVGGQALKNQMLSQIRDGWIVILDDDTIMHRDFFRSVVAILNGQPHLSAIVVSQKRTTGEILVAAAENVIVGSIDAGQAILKRELIGQHRLPPTYAGDGLWLEALLQNRDDVAYVTDVLSLHNELSGINVSESAERMLP